MFGVRGWGLKPEMWKKFFLVMMMALWVVGCAAMGGLQERESAAGKSVPVITDSFASSTMRPGDTWKVYLKASDPSGEMKYIISVVSQPGQGPYPISFTRVRGENSKELSGYIYLNTLVPSGYKFLDFASLSLTVQIKDNAGNFSKPVEFSLYFDPRASGQESPPAGVFKEQSLGPILVTLRPFDEDGQNGDGFF